MTRWTNEQKTAIDARGCNLLVAAAAGSGKTAVLVERILELILNDGIDIDSMLIVTFTNAAAGEMRERIGNAILKAIDERSGDETHLRRQLNLLSHASISTLHSFCISVLRKYFHAIDLDPGFRIADESETLILKMDAMESLMEDAYNRGDQLFLGLVDRYGGNKQDTPLQELILKLHSFIQSNPDPFKWLKKKVDQFNLSVDDVSNSSWYKALVNHIRIELSGAIQILKEGLVLCNKPLGPASYESAINDDINKYNELLKWLNKDIRLCWRKAAELEFERFSRCSKDVDEELKDSVKKLRDDAKKIFNDLRKNLFQLSLEDYINDLNDLYPYMKTLYDLVKAFDNYFRKEKEDRGLIDFNDLEHYTLQVLAEDDIAHELRDKYNYIFIDEYQDSNIVQETIIDRIKRDDNLFMVGDVKQSIYRFRLADPSLFIHKYNTFKNKEGAVNRRVDLNKNFRSDVNILYGVNLIFENIMSEEFGEVSYDQHAALHPGLIQELPEPKDDIEILDSKIELHLADKSSSNINGEGEELNGIPNEEQEALNERFSELMEDLSQVEMEALITAKRIKELLETHIYDKSLGGYRKVEYRDIVILMRSTKYSAPVFYDILSGQGFPVYADVNNGYFDSIEVATIIELLRLIDNKKQDIPLLAVMRSPIGNFNAMDLIKIRTSSKSKAFYDAVDDYLKNNNDKLSIRLSNFLDRLKEWQQAARHLNMEDLLWKLYMDTGYFYYAGSMPGGIQRQANLNMLLEKARQFQNTSARGIFGFLQFVDKLKSSSGDMGVAKVLSENENVIRIMSIHKSKGLEFPIVIVACMGKRFNLRDTSAQVIIHKNIGIGPKYVDPTTRQTCDTIARIAMKNVIRFESLSEEMRILYVAMTRAKTKLILLGTVNDIEKQVVNWSKSLSIYNLSRGKTYLDWICSVLMRYRDGYRLREMVKVEAPALYEQLNDNNNGNESSWGINIHDKQSVVNITETDALEAEKLRDWLESPSVEPDNELNRLINDRFSWKYPFREAAYIPSKLTVTQIKKLNTQRALSAKAEPSTPLYVDTSSLIERPRFMEGTKKFTGAQKGTITHFVLQHLKLDGDLTYGGIKSQIEDMVDAQLLTEEEGDVVDINKIVGFFKSDIGKRVLAAEKVWREVPFNYRKEANRLINDVDRCDETLLMQGVIDCYFEEDDQWVLVDYKTDFILNDNDLNRVVSQYTIQIELYAEALENITGKPVKEKILYLFSIDRGVAI